jgi:hypothetical protein
MSKAHRRVSDEVNKELAEISMAAKAAKAANKIKISKSKLRLAAVPKNQEILDAFRSRKSLKGRNFESTGDVFKLFGNTIARNVDKGVEVSTAGFPTTKTMDTLRALGINIRTQKGVTKLNNETQIDPKKADFHLVPKDKVSKSKVFFSTPEERAKQKERNKLRETEKGGRTMVEQRKFREQMRERFSGDKQTIPDDPTAIQPQDQKKINSITGIDSPIPNSRIKGTESHHILFRHKFPGLKDNPNNAVPLDADNHKELHSLNAKLEEALQKLALDERSTKGLGIVAPGGIDRRKLKQNIKPTPVTGRPEEDQIAQPGDAKELKKRDRLVKITPSRNSGVSTAKQRLAMAAVNDVLKFLKKGTPRREQLVPTTLKSTFLGPDGNFVNSVGDRHDATAKQFAAELGIELTGGNLDDDAANEQLQRKTGLIRTQNRVNKPLMADIRTPITQKQLRTLQEFGDSDQGIFVSVKDPETGEQVGVENSRDLPDALRRTNQLQGKCKPCTQMKVSKSKMKLAAALLAKNGQEKVNEMLDANNGQVPEGTFGFIDGAFSEVNADENPSREQLNIRKQTRDRMNTQEDESLNFVSRTAGVGNVESLPLLLDRAAEEGFEAFPGGFQGERGQEFDVGIAVNTKIDSEIQKFLQLPALNDPKKNQESSLTIRPDLSVEFVKNKKFLK